MALFHPAKATRKGSPRATKPDARAKLVHTSHGGRQLVAYVTAPLMKQIGWREGGHVAIGWAVDDDALLVRLAPGHSGPRACRNGQKTTTTRIVISGDFIAPSACAPVRVVPFQIDGNAIVLSLPRAWAALDRVAAA